MSGTLGLHHPMVRLLFAALIVLTGVAWPVQFAPETRAQSSIPNADWMANMAGAIGNVPLNRVVLPGTHDSGTYAITLASEESPDSPIPGIKQQISDALASLDPELAAVGPGLITAMGPMMKPILVSWAKAQDQTISDQLAGGVRYLDIRLCPKGDDLHICHSLYGDNVTVILEDVREFIDAHPQEIVLLDFNHLVSNVPSFSQRAALASMIVSTFTTSGGQPGDLLVSSGLGPTSTINDIWATSGRVVALFDDPFVVEQHQPHLWLGQQEDHSGLIESPWPEKNNVTGQREAVYANLACRCDTKPDPDVAVEADQLFVLQTQPTPDPALIGASLLEWLEQHNSGSNFEEQVDAAIHAIRLALGWQDNPPTSLQDLAISARNSIVLPVLADSLNNALLRQNLNIVQVDYYELTPVVEGAKTLNGAQAGSNFWLATGSDISTPAFLNQEGQVEITASAELELRRSPVGTLFSSRSVIGRTIARSAFAAPSAATAPYIAWTDENMQIHVGVVDESGTSLSQQAMVPNASSFGGPAMAVLGDRLYLAWTEASDGQVNLVSFPIVNGVPQIPQVDTPVARLGVTARQYMTSDGQTLTFVSPSLAVFDGQLYLAWTDAELGLHLGRVDTSSSNLALATDVSLGVNSIFGPSLAVFKGNLYLLWAGDEAYPGFVSRPVAFGPLHLGRVASDGSGLVADTFIMHTRSSSEPSITVFQDALYIAWVDAEDVRLWRTNDGVTFSAGLLSSFGIEINTGNHIGPALLALPGPSLNVTATTADGPYTPGNWTNQAVEVTFICAATGSSIKSLTVHGAATVNGTGNTVTVTVDSEGQDQFLHAICEDSGGLTSQVSFGPIQIDKTKPVISAAATAGNDPYQAGTWTNRDVIVTFTCADAGDGQSGIASDTVSSSTVTAETAGTSVTSDGSCVDNAGNEADPASFGPVQIDKTKPLITASATIASGQDDTPPYTAGTWTNQDVLVSFTCAEAGEVQSGIASNTLVNQTLTTEGDNQSATSTGNCLDAAGNAADAVTFGPIRIDKTAPAINIESPTGTTYLLNEVVTAAYECVDPLLANGDLPSGVATCTGTVTDGGAIDTAWVGGKNFAVDATDNAGNASQASISYNVSYQTDVRYDNTIAYPAGEKIPLRLELQDVNGTNVSDGSIAVTAVGIADASGIVRDLGEVFQYVPPGGPNPGMYLYKVDTAGLESGSYTLLFTAGNDPTIHEVPFTVE